MTYTTRVAKAAAYKRTPGKGPCLIARPGTNLPNCHENDFCECDMRDESARLQPLLELLGEALDLLSEGSDGKTRLVVTPWHVRARAVLSKAEQILDSRFANSEGEGK